MVTSLCPSSVSDTRQVLYSGEARVAALSVGLSGVRAALWSRTLPTPHTRARARARTHTVIAGTDGATMHPMYFNLTCAVFCPPRRRVGRSLVQLRTARAILLPRRVKPDAVGATNMIQAVFRAQQGPYTVPLTGWQGTAVFAGRTAAAS